MAPQAEASFDDQILNLEVDFEDLGGLQRFERVAEVKRWIAEERRFWDWLQRPPANQQAGSYTEVSHHFWEYEQRYNRDIKTAEDAWKRLASDVQDLSGGESSEDRAEHIAKLEKQQGTVLHTLAQGLKGMFADQMIRQRRHLPRCSEPAQIVAGIAAEDPKEAMFALDHILLKFRNQPESRLSEFNGRLKATFFLERLPTKPAAARKAFAEAVKSWERELGSYKSQYDQRQQEFQKLAETIHETSEAWKEGTDEMETQFGEMLKAEAANLQNLKDTYERYMQLQGPMTYWRGKRKLHLQQIRKLRGWSVFVGIAGFLLVAGAGWMLLPANHPADTVPWREIGFFVLLSTFVLWGVRLVVKLLLSHIHLYSDAQEREVMISTYMALMRREESRKGLQKEDLALLLAPIFRPSTTGVIKDDGGPTTLTDFISRVAGGKQ